jgi:hypothetical protein
MSNPRLVLLAALFTTGLWACDTDDGEADADAKPAAGDTAAQGVEKIIEDAVDKADKEAGAHKLFAPEDKTLRKRGCEVLTADLVAETFGVPAGELKQFKIMGCAYVWKKDDQMLDAKVMLIRVHKTLEGAQTWFKNATATKTKEQIDAEMEMIKGKAQERKELDTKLKKKTAAGIMDIAKMGTPDEGVRYEDVPGIGDEARISSENGTIWNLTFNVAAYKGTPEPQLKIDPKNLKDITKRAMENQKNWLADTMDQRTADAKRLAPLVVKAFEAL